MGRTAAPAPLRLINGRREGQDSGGRKVKPPPGFKRLPPSAPEWLPDEARALWDRVVPELQRLELTKPADAEALAAYCLCWQRLRDARAVIAGGGPEGMFTTNAAGSLVKHPAVLVEEAASKELRAWAVQFGLTPSAESGVGKGGGDAEEDANPFG